MRQNLAGPGDKRPFAAKRIERKRQRELEQQMEAVSRGELPDNLRVAPELPAQPDINQYLSDDGLAKYDYDQSRALAASNAANTEYDEAQDARSNAVAEQGKKTGVHAAVSRLWMQPVNTTTRPKTPTCRMIRRKRTLLDACPGIDARSWRCSPKIRSDFTYHLGAKPREGARYPEPCRKPQAIIELIACQGSFNSQTTR